MSKPVTSPHGGCFSHPISGRTRYCGEPTVATVRPAKKLTVNDEPHPTWRACTHHAGECDKSRYTDDGTVVEWDGKERA